jgi:Flp pilus assembly protein TadG
MSRVMVYLRLSRLSPLSTDKSGLALIEFAIGMPILLLAGGWGIELSQYALVQLEVSQYALHVADNASRVGVVDANGVSTLRETDINDILQAAVVEGTRVGLTTNGRITLSSLENVNQDYDATQKQRIHWQRCTGVKSGTTFDSTFGVANILAGRDAPAGYSASANDAYAGLAVPTGMGPSGAMILAPDDSGVMYVEINYQYQPVFGTYYMSPTMIKYTASFIVRDNRDFSKVTNPSPTATASTCNLHTAGPTKINTYP